MWADMALRPYRQSARQGTVIDERLVWSPAGIAPE
jgi:hypothetical protein